MQIVELQTVDSTNDHAKMLARDGVESGTVVWAHEQTAGRGRQGNNWVSNRGNLFMTMILRPKVERENIGQLSFLAAVALADVLSIALPDATVNLKWPNDVLLNGKKVAGILIETESGSPWAVIGIGVNVKHAPEGAISLHAVGARTYDAETVLKMLGQEILRLVKILETVGFAQIREAWMARAYKLGEEIRARLPKETVTGVFSGIDEAGILQLQLADGSMRNVNSGEVFL